VIDVSLIYLISMGHESRASKTMVATLMQSLSCSNRTSHTDSRVSPSMRIKVFPSKGYITGGTVLFKKDDKPGTSLALF